MNYGGYAVYYGDDGKTVVLDGVTISDSGYNPYQLNGTIHTAGTCAIGTILHEYGHYLQQQEMGTFDYLMYAGSGSLHGYLNSDVNYYDIDSECDANIRAMQYMGQYYPEYGLTPSGW